MVDGDIIPDAWSEVYWPGDDPPSFEARPFVGRSREVLVHSPIKPGDRSRLLREAAHRICRSTKSAHPELLNYQRKLAVRAALDDYVAACESLYDESVTPFRLELIIGACAWALRDRPNGLGHVTREEIERWFY